MNAGDVKVRLIADLAKYSGNITKATGLIRGFAAIGTKSIGLLTRSMRSLTGLPALGVGAMLGGSVAQIAKFQEQMAFVSTMLDDQSMKLMPQYEKAVQRMSVQFGESTATISRGLYQTLSASIEPTKALGFLTAALKAAKAGMTDTETAADTLSTMLNAYGYDAKYAGLMSDRLFGIVKRGKTTFPELASSLGNVASGAALVKMNIETLGAALSTMTRSGLSTSEAVTALNRLIMSFNKPRGNAEKVAAKFEIEMNATTLAGNGLLDVLVKLKKAMDEGRATTKDIASLASRETGYKALAILLQHVEEVQRDYNEQTQTAGETDKQAAKATDQLMHRLRQFWQLLLDISRNAIEPFADDLKKLIDYTVRHREAIVAWVNGVMKNLRSVIVFLGTEWQTGWKTSGKAIEAVMQATVDVVSIILEDGMVAIGKNLPKWIWKGISVGNIASQSLWKSVGEKIGLSISGSIGKALTILPGGVGARMLENVQRTQEELNSAQEEGVGTAGKLKTVYNQLGDTLAKLVVEQQQVADTTGVRGATNAWHQFLGEIESIIAAFKGAGWTPGMKQLIEESRKAGVAIKDIGKGIKESFGQPIKFPDPKPSPEQTGDAKEAATQWEKMWEDAASGIDGAMEDAFVSITKDARTATEALENMLAAMQEAISRAVFQQYLMPGINDMFGRIMGAPSFGSTVQQSQTVQEGPFESGFARGGLVYAQSGLFRPRGTDTVPAMLTPGEGVLDSDLTARLRKTLAVAEPSPAASRPININISAIDAAGTYQFLQKNRRAIASMVGDSQRTNHPVTRSNR